MPDLPLDRLLQQHSLESPLQHRGQKGPRSIYEASDLSTDERRKNRTKDMRKVPLLHRRVLNFEEFGRIYTWTAALLDAKCEALVRDTICRLSPTRRCMSLEADVEELTGEELGLIRRENTSQRRAGSQSSKSLGERNWGKCSEESDKCWAPVTRHGRADVLRTLH